jgi:hypothetical protein
MADSHTDPVAEAVAGSLPDVGKLRFADFLRSDHPAIAYAAERVRDEAEQETPTYAAFGSAP